MKTILITPKNQTEFKMLTVLFKKMNIANTILTDEQKEDIGMVWLMKKADRTKTVKKETVMKKLNEK